MEIDIVRAYVERNEILDDYINVMEFDNKLYEVMVDEKIVLVPKDGIWRFLDGFICGYEIIH